MFNSLSGQCKSDALPPPSPPCWVQKEKGTDGAHKAPTSDVLRSPGIRTCKEANRRLPVFSTYVTYQKNPTAQPTRRLLFESNLPLLLFFFSSLFLAYHVNVYIIIIKGKRERWAGDGLDERIVLVVAEQQGFRPLNCGRKLSHPYEITSGWAGVVVDIRPKTYPETCGSVDNSRDPMMSPGSSWPQWRITGKIVRESHPSH